MVMECNRAKPSRAFLQRYFQSLAYCRFTHRLVRAQGDHHIQFVGHAVEVRVERLEAQTDGRRPGAIRHDDQDAFMAESFLRAGDGDHIGDLGRGDLAVGWFAFGQ